MAKLVPGSFSVDHLGIYPGFVQSTQDEDSNGPTQPLFTFDVAQVIAADWSEFEGQPDEPPAQAFYESDDDAFHLYEPATNEWHVLTGETYGPAKLYAMGRDLWTWQRSLPHRGLDI